MQRKHQDFVNSVKVKEKLRAEIEKLKHEIKAKDLVAKQRKNISEQLKEATFQLERQLSILKEKQDKQKLDIFKREQTVMERLRAFGKHNDLKIKTGTND